MLKDNEGCARLTRVFYQGQSAGDVFMWSVECPDKRLFLVSVNGNTGESKTLSCTFAATLNAECFKKF